MFWQRKSEIQKVLEQYGHVKGTQFLTYLFTIAQEGTSSLKTGKESTTKNMMQYAISNILNRHNDTYLKEYSEFQAKHIKNQKLLGELSKEKGKYTDLSIFAKPATNWCEAKPVEKKKHCVKYIRIALCTGQGTSSRTQAEGTNEHHSIGAVEFRSRRTQAYYLSV